MKFFSVINYDQQQHYKDRGPTWIKLYNRLLDDYGFAHLPDAAKWHLIGIQLQASRHDNRVPADPAWLARQIGAIDAIDLDVLVQAGFIAPLPDVDSDPGVPGNPASTEKRRVETEGENNHLSAHADPLNVYSKGFEEFWKAYPTDQLMSKKRAHDIWRGMRLGEQAKAMQSLEAFCKFVAQRHTYRPVHAWKYLTERRYEGFVKTHLDPATVAAAKDRADRLLKRGKYAEKYE
jgi:hypothetical protein